MRKITKVNVELINSWLSLTANIGVLVGIYILIFEVEQNSLIARAQMRSEIAQSAIDNIGMNMTAEGIEITDKQARGEELSPGEVSWLRSFYRREFRAWENVHYQYRMGLYDENEMESYRFFWRARAESCEQLYDEFYARSRMQFEPNFRSEMDEYFETANCRF